MSCRGLVTVRSVFYSVAPVSILQLLFCVIFILGSGTVSCFLIKRKEDRVCSIWPDRKLLSPCSLFIQFTETVDSRRLESWY